MKYAGCLLIALYLAAGCTSRESGVVDNNIRLLVVAGGHGFDTTAFVETFMTFDSIEFDTLMQPNANKKLSEGIASNYDVILFYDMWNTEDTGVVETYRHLVRQGPGLVFMHHSLAGYNGIDYFEELIGGTYVKPEEGMQEGTFSTYKHDIDLPVKPAEMEHPVTRGVRPFTILDEGYGNIRVSDDVTIFLTADHPECYPAIGWEHTVGKSKVVYLMLGHDKRAYHHPEFRRLVQNAIRFADDQSPAG